jgi:transketolase
MTYENLLEELIEKDDRFIVMTAENRAAIRNLPGIIADRFIDVGIAEQTMIGMAVGLAKRGRIPIVHALATFLTMRAFEFIRTDIGISGYPVKLVGAVAGFLSEGNGPTHQAIEDISLMRGIPGMNIFCPSDIDDMLIGLPEILTDNKPWYIRYNNLELPMEHKKDFEVGRAEIISWGDDINILTYGTLLKQAVEAAGILNSEKFSTGVINLRTLKPFDEELILDLCTRSSLVITLEDHFHTGGLYSIVSELLVKNKLMTNLLPINLKNKWFKPALLKDVILYEKFDNKSIARSVLTEFNKQVSNEVFF